MTDQNISNANKCPVVGRHTAGGSTSNQHWWPNQLNLKILNQNWESNKDELIQYIATAHHAPSTAKKDAKQWITGGMTLPYKYYTEGRLLDYAKKTEANLEHLNKSKELTLALNRIRNTKTD